MDKKEFAAFDEAAEKERSLVKAAMPVSKRCDPSLLPQRDGRVCTTHVLVPPEEDQDQSMGRLLSDPETMAHLPFMIASKDIATIYAKIRRKDRDLQQVQKTHLNYNIAVKKSQIPAHVLDKISSEGFLPPRKLQIDDGEINMDEPYVVVGCCGLNHIDYPHHLAEAGIILDARFWRSGICTEAMYMVLRFGFDVLKMHRIGILTTGKNDGMRGWMEKVAGVDAESVKKDALYDVYGNSYMDSWEYAIFENQWYESIAQKLRDRVEKKHTSK
ncbi:hypothetical protein IW140_000210 [Coemansia sp. RSA 1813]|nr:hypothetical protein EV178_000413 [Coemansia sp. RSA 1646]KAJ1773816.1 hypothetical protein LPJ74_000360 [Coemansia sp. RSA 1843]KAJ2093780.1 hypothetical protein IW138_000176 [Coemansia sp. RSA 986]KAJ2217990.1 hypothetical protein EV179_000135 [Coemansia sp. RSA 487]KAJ2573167.1 hypothetical protein IW140_000210 [Coemansia sp. RSA 1813]